MAIFSSFVAASKSKRLASAKKVGEDENCNFCADFVSDPSEAEEQQLSPRAPSRASTVNLQFPYNGCKQQLITTNGVLTDCITRSRNFSSRQSNYEDGTAPKRKSSLDPYLPSFGVQQPAVVQATPEDGESGGRLRRHSSANEMTHFRSRSYANGWVVIDVKSKSRTMSG